MNASHHDTQNSPIVSWGWVNHSEVAHTSLSNPKPSRKPKFDLLQPLRHWLDAIDIQDAKVARSICQWIPSQCPFARNISVLGRTVLRIPPLCKLNPVYDQVVALRFRALCYLADVCGEDVTPYC